MAERRLPDFPAADPAGARRPGKKTLATVLGSAAAAALLFTFTPEEESGRTVQATVAADGTAQVRHLSGKQYLQAYLDIVGVPTACDGITKGVKLGQTYTEAQCAAMLERELIAHAEPIVKCAPGLYGRPYQAVAVVLLGYNIGVGGVCRGSIGRHLNGGNWAAASAAFLPWNKGTFSRPQKGKVCVRKARGGYLCPIGGLTARRHRERCIFDMDRPDVGTVPPRDRECADLRRKVQAVVRAHGG